MKGITSQGQLLLIVGIVKEKKKRSERVGEEHAFHSSQRNKTWRSNVRTKKGKSEDPWPSMMINCGHHDYDKDDGNNDGC